MTLSTDRPTSLQRYREDQAERLRRVEKKLDRLISENLAQKPPAQDLNPASRMTAGEAQAAAEHSQFAFTGRLVRLHLASTFRALATALEKDLRAADDR